MFRSVFVKRILDHHFSNKSGAMTNHAQQFFEGCGHEGPIRCIFLSEFHPVAGSKITCQVLHSMDDAFKQKWCSPVFLFYFRRQMVMYRKRYSMLSTFILYRSHNCSVAWWLCKLTTTLFNRSFLMTHFAEMPWATKLLAILSESTINAMLATHSTSIYVLFVIHGHEPYSMSQLSRNYPNIS